MQNLKKLSVWAKENNMSYKEAWSASEAGILPVKTKKSKTNRIYVIEGQESNKDVVFGTPSIAATQQQKTMVANYRFNKSALTTPAYQYNQIEQGIIPYQIDGNSSSDASNVSISDTEVLF